MDKPVISTEKNTEIINKLKLSVRIDTFTCSFFFNKKTFIKQNRVNKTF